jgi:poly-gamma-glutamate synthesis protein (capsule biosynthesis protein)
VPPAHNLNAYSEAGFNVMSLANNHIGDGGHSAMLETRDRLRSQGIATCGAGRNLPEARAPAIVEREGVKIGFLAYSSTFPHGYEARAAMPGLAPLRAYNHFHEQSEYYSPGYLPRIETIPDPEDHRNLESDIAALRKTADLVVLSFHWGDHLRPFALTDHERRTARFCIDRGADLVIGHHHHALRGVEWYGGKPIFYGLGHLVFDLHVVLTEEVKAFIGEVDPESYALAPREGWPLLPLHPDTRITMLGWAQLREASIRNVGFVPCRLRPDGRVAAVDPDSVEGKEVVEYVSRCNTSQRLNGQVSAENAPTIGGHRSLRIVPLDGPKASE